MQLNQQNKRGEWKLSVSMRDFPEELHHKTKVQAEVERITLNGGG
jgi:hypothetical protein